MEPLSNPKSDRQVPNLVPPPHRPLSRSILFPNSGKYDGNKPNWRLLRDHFSKEGRLAKEDTITIIDQVLNIFRRERNLQEIEDPCTVVGDIHGQYYDLITILERGGDPEWTMYLFLGDFVDRGSFGIEVILLLFCIKINYPKTTILLRGNHECRSLTTYFNFRAEWLQKYDLDIFDHLMDCFDALPLACIINGQFLAVHGGLSPELVTLDDIDSLNRFSEPPRMGIYWDILWSDPVGKENGKTSDRYRHNGSRGCAYYFNASAAKQFLKQNGLLSVIRAHEAQIEGYKLYKWTGANEFPSVITIFSAPNYWDSYKNRGAILKLEDNNLNIQQYNESEHPYVLPGFTDIFDWSMPFMIEKVMEILMYILNQKVDDLEIILPADNHKIHDYYAEEFNKDSTKNIVSRIQNEQELPRVSKISNEATTRKYEIIKRRILFLGKMMKMMKTLREHNEDVIRVKEVTADSKIPQGLLSQGSKALQRYYDTFAEVRDNDAENERMPGT